MKILKNEGFSLLEVLVALAIFGMFFGGLFVIIQQENHLIKNSADMLMARLIANEAMETLKAYPYEKLENYSFTSPTIPNNMSVKVFVSDFDSSTCKKIVVTVRWVDPRGSKRYLTLSTLRSKYTFGTAKGGREQ
jgi:prepilin-type N-terminal cleavage/methylation domain-containing protein